VGVKAVGDTDGHARRQRTGTQDGWLWICGDIERIRHRLDGKHEYAETL
jgi:hypothetical protein